MVSFRSQPSLLPLNIGGDPVSLSGISCFTVQVILPDVVMKVRDKLAKNIHDVWAKGKIDAGYKYGEVRNDTLKHNASLKPFEELTESEQQYDYSMALETLATLVALGYQIGSQVRVCRLQTNYMRLS